MSLRVRLALMVAITFAIVVVGCVFAAHVSTSHELRAQVDRFLQQRAGVPGIDDRNRGPNPGFGFDNDRDPSPIEPDAVVQLLDHQGNVVVPGHVPLPVDARDHAIASSVGPGKPQQLRTVSVDDTAYRMLTVRTDNGAAQIARDISSTNNVLGTLDLRLLLIALAGTVVAAALAWLIARQIVRPVERLTAATEHVATTQDLENTIPVDRHDELGRLAASFNTMLVALRGSQDQQKRLVMDASHELRTPLTALRTNVEVLQRSSTLSDAERAELLESVDVELRELTELVIELVDLATDARSEEPPQTVDLGELATRVVDRFSRRNQRTIGLTLDDPALVGVRLSALERAVSNLVDNACKFTPAEHSIDVVVRGASIEVLDRGPGIPAEDRGHVFDRFYRSPAARTMPGSGLGLAIVKQVVELQGGTVEVNGRDGGGTVARITLPVATAPS